jgi:hypothetical protein
MYEALYIYIYIYISNTVTISKSYEMSNKGNYTLKLFY